MQFDSFLNIFDMKKILAGIAFFLIATFGIQSPLSGQTYVFRYDNHRSNYGYQNDNNYNHNRQRDRYRNNYRREEYLYNSMGYYDRKELRRLERKLNDRINCAWEDNYLSDREIRRIRDVERDIFNLYERQRAINYRSRNNSDRRRYRGCR